jgi:hypothetical protein
MLHFLEGVALQVCLVMDLRLANILGSIFDLNLVRRVDN